MSTKGENRSIEEIFREQFKGYSPEPSASAWKGLRRRLGVREFLQFNPVRFNVFYAGALAAAITVTALLTLAGRQDNRSTDSDPGMVGTTHNPSAAAQVAGGGVTANTPVSKGSPAASNLVTTEKVKVTEERSGDEAVEGKSAARKRREIEPSAIIEETGTIIAKPGENLSSKLVRPAPEAIFTPGALSGCVPLSLSFENLSLNYDSCLWEFGDGGYSTETSPVWVFDEEGTYRVKLLVFGTNGEIAARGTEIRVFPAPKAKFEVSTGDPLIPDEHVSFYNYSENSVGWHWDFGDGETSRDFEPTHTYDRHNSYAVRLIAYSEQGCTDTLTITDAFGANSCFLRFPNAFIPNDGGPTGGYYSSRTDIESEVFHPVWSGVTDYNLKIFSRTGVLMFESSDINVGWDGYYRGQKAEPGVYIWKVRGVFKNGDPFVKGGDLTLLPRR